MDYFLENFLTYVLLIKFFIVAMYLLRTVMGPSIWDRLLGMNLVASKTIMIIAIFASMNEITFLVDFAIIYALFGFIGTIFIALFLSKYKLGKIRHGKNDASPKADKVDTKTQTQGGDA
ncbi:MAG: monovalent cation/H+ antiporter complex subunit F [Defluviitaleaceae bacterium]|nr:monovalent cation/H+ antiporter complex subunit F [Defluviitaleaceae bacterium]